MYRWRVRSTAVEYNLDNASTNSCRSQTGRESSCAVCWQIHTSAILRRKSDLPKQGDQLRYVAGLDFVEPISCHQRCSNFDRNLSALVSQKPRVCISTHAALTGLGRLGGGSGRGVVTIGSYCRAFRRLGRFLNPPRNSSNAVGILGLAMWFLSFWVLVACIICLGPVPGTRCLRKLRPPYPSSMVPSLALPVVILSRRTRLATRHTR